MIVKERRTVWYFRSWESMSTYSTILLTQLVTKLTIGSAGKSSTAQSGHDVLSLLYNQVIYWNHTFYFCYLSSCQWHTRFPWLWYSRHVHSCCPSASWTMWVCTLHDL